jgi:DNA-binding NarL/FixJ family response regulator
LARLDLWLPERAIPYNWGALYPYCAMIRLLLVDDQSLICQGLKAMLSLEPDLDVVGTAEHGEAALEQVAALQPDVILMDMRMPVMDGRQATRLISEQHPQVKVLVLSTFDDDGYIADSIRAGAKGYLLKDMPSDELAQAIRLVHRGYTQLAPGLLDKLLESQDALSPSLVLAGDADSGTHSARAELRANPDLEQLTPRERDVLALIARGLSNRDIAEQLYISEGTVKTHVTHLLNRLQLKNRAQLAIYANSGGNALGI